MPAAASSRSRPWGRPVRSASCASKARTRTGASPPPEKESRHVAGALRGHLRVGNPLASPPVESGRRVVVPLLAVPRVRTDSGAWRCVRDLERMEAVRSNAAQMAVFHVVDPQACSGRACAARRYADAFRRERRLEAGEEVTIGIGLDSSPRSRYGS